MATVTERDAPIEREWVGTVAGSVDAVIHAQVSGYLVKQSYEEGANVTKGQPLFEIDDRPFVAAVQKATADVGKATADLAKTENDVARLRPLIASKAVSQQDYDNAVQASAAAKSVLDAAKASLEKAQLDLKFTRIESPIDGIAGRAKAQIGELVGPSGGELTTVSTVDPVRVYFLAGEQHFLTVRQRTIDEGKKAEPPKFTLILSNGAVYPHTGEFKFVDREVDLNTGAIRVAVEFVNPDGLLRPGMFCRLRAPLEVVKNAVVVPQRAVTDMQGQRLVAVVGADSKVEVRPVQMGERVEGGWIVKSGLKAGETIVVEGVQKARPGVTVKATPFEPAAPAPAPPADAVPAKPATH